MEHEKTVSGTSGTQRKKILHTRNMDTWLLLYPTTKAWVSLKFYTTITLNIQFLNVFTEPAMHYRGAFHLCLKKKKKKKRVGSKAKSRGWSVFVQCWLFVLTQSSNLQRLQLPTEHSTAPIHRWGVNRGGEARVFVFRGGTTERRGEPLEGGKKTKPAGFMSVHVSF